MPVPSVVEVKKCNATDHHNYVRTLGGLTSASYGLARDVLCQVGFGGVLRAAGAVGDKSERGGPRSSGRPLPKTFSVDTKLVAKDVAATSKPDCKSRLVQHPGLIK